LAAARIAQKLAEPQKASFLPARPLQAGAVLTMMIGLRYGASMGVGYIALHHHYLE
jgi:hypothetical protein